MLRRQRSTNNFDESAERNVTSKSFSTKSSVKTNESCCLSIFFCDFSDWYGENINYKRTAKKNYKIVKVETIDRNEYASRPTLVHL